MNFDDVRWGMIGRMKATLASCGVLAPKRLNLLAGYMEFGRWLRKNGLRRRATLGDRRSLFAHINDATAKDNPIDYLEFGVFRGASLKIWLDVNQNPESRFFGFDSFWAAGSLESPDIFRLGRQIRCGRTDAGIQ